MKQARTGSRAEGGRMEEGSREEKGRMTKEGRERPMACHSHCVVCQSSGFSFCSAAGCLWSTLAYFTDCLFDLSD